MTTLLIALAAFVGYIVAYHTYGRWLARRIFRLDPQAPVPSRQLRDDVDFVPTRKEVIFGHHFTSIAGTGPIVGPAIAVFWGWLPALLWVLLGSIFIGAVHDFSALVISLRNRGQTVGEIAGRMIAPRARILFLLILFFALSIVVAIFGLIIASIFKLYPESVLSVWVKESWPALALYRQDLLLAPTRILEGIDLLGDEAIVVHYEDLVVTPATTVSSLCKRLDISYSPDMLHYGDRPAPEGRYGDSTGIHKHKAPTTDSLQKWIRLADREQTQHLALSYLDDLGPEVIEGLGYSYHELKNAIGRVPTPSSSALVPWHIILRPAETWTRKERLIVERAMAIQREGSLRGSVSFLRGNARAIARYLLPV